MNTPSSDWRHLPIEQRAELERKLLAAKAAGARVRLERAPLGQRIPLSFAQQRFWFLEQLDAARAAYNIARGYRLRGSLDASILQKALSAVVARHEVLRTTFVVVNDEPTQRIAPHLPVTIPIVDLSALDPEDRELRLETILAEEAQRPFRLAEDPMLRAILYRLEPREHVLLLATHHIASDAWSHEILLRELSVLYTANLSGRAPELPPLPIQYAQYAAHQRSEANQRAWEAQLAFWKKQLAGAPPLLDLPADFPRPPRETFRGRMVSCLLPQELLAGLIRLGRESGTTLYMTLLGAFQVLLSRYTGTTDICVGSPVAGRNQVEIESLIGLFVNTIALRTNLEGRPSFREVLERVRNTTLDAYSNQELPFERLVQELQPNRNLSHSPIYQVIFALQNTTLPQLRIPGAVVTPIALHSGTAKVDLTWEATEQPDGLLIRAEYNSDLFREESVSRMIGHYRTLLESVVANADQPISKLSILTEPEHRQILDEWATPSPSAADPANWPCECVHHRIESQCAATPDRIAVVGSNQRLTYRELNEQANRLSHWLIAQGVQPDSVVGVSLPHTPRLLVSMLAIVKAGAAYLPLDPDLPAARRRLILNDSQVALVVTNQSEAGFFEDAQVQVIDVDRDAMNIAAQSVKNPNVDVTGENLCYVLYTSGSTGQPKGSQNPHRAVVNLLDSATHEPGISGDDVVLASTRASFDVGTFELFLPLFVGARIEMIERQVVADGHRFHAEICRICPTLMFATPAGWDIVLSAGRLPQGIRAISGGDVLRPELAANLLSQTSELWNIYGPTETTIYSTIQRIVSPDDITIGRPVANTELYVLDRDGELVPSGIPGELYIGGAGLARGYWNRTELTREKFVKNPFRSDANSRLYRTGDNVRWRSDGRIAFLGRVDRQVKIRGFRIELGEIEKVLGAHPGVEDCVVLTNSENTQLIGFAALRSKEAVSAIGLRDWMAKELPDYMIPSRFILLAEFPLLPNGKVDRNALPAIAAEYNEPEELFVAPATAVEQMVADTWAEVLQVERVGRNDNFFRLGGHSLAAMRVIARLNNLYQVDLSVRQIFEAPTVKEMSQRLLSSVEESGDNSESLPEG